MVVRKSLLSALEEARDLVGAELCLPGDQLPTVRLSVPPGGVLADYSTDLALELARVTREPAPALARTLSGRLSRHNELIERVEVSPSGLLNFHLRAGWTAEAIREACLRGEDYGKTAAGPNALRVQVEMVSANPTGPLTISHGRGAALGDAVASLLEWTGHRVTRESYVNDAGRQQERFGKALEAAYSRKGGTERGEGAAEFVTSIAAGLRADLGSELEVLSPPERTARLAQEGIRRVLDQHRDVLARMGVRIDVWRSELVVLAAGKLAEVILILKEKDLVYEAEGAVWLRSSAMGEADDYPLIRSSHQPTYLAGDLAYHLDKFNRGFDRVIDIWGPHHAEYVARTLSAVRALECGADALEIIVFQPVSLKIEGVVRQAGEGNALGGNNLLLEQVIEKAGRDTLRSLYLSRPAGSPLELDLDSLDSEGGPLAQVLRAFASARARTAEWYASELAAELTEPATLITPGSEALIRVIADFEDEISLAAGEREPARLVRYALDVASAWDTFQSGVTGGESIPAAAVSKATQVVLGNTLTILGISRPD